jgi:hypothetical protein
MENVGQKKASERCKHGLGVGTCWLCKGHKPTPECARRDLLYAGGSVAPLTGHRNIGNVNLEFMNLEDAAQESAGSIL